MVTSFEDFEDEDKDIDDEMDKEAQLVAMAHVEQGVSSNKGSGFCKHTRTCAIVSLLAVMFLAPFCVCCVCFDVCFRSVFDVFLFRGLVGSGVWP